MAQMIESFHLIDNDLLIPFDIRAETFLILEDITTGSLRTCLTTMLRSVDDAEVIKVKKPDYLGDSMWELKYRDRVIPAKITDHDWLLEFQSRKVDVRPGDALSVVLQTQINYGFQGEEISVHYRILKVKEVIPDTSPEQGDLLSP